MAKVYELTRDNIVAEHVDAEEKSLGESITLNRGTVLTIVRAAHLWGGMNAIEYCTVQIGGKYFNIPALVLAGSIISKRS